MSLNIGDLVAFRICGIPHVGVVDEIASLIVWVRSGRRMHWMRVSDAVLISPDVARSIDRVMEALSASR